MFFLSVVSDFFRAKSSFIPYFIRAHTHVRFYLEYFVFVPLFKLILFLINNRKMFYIYSGISDRIKENPLNKNKFLRIILVFEVKNCHENIFIYSQ